MWLICGLGNPGKKYQSTRHNIGFALLDALIQKNKFELHTKDKTQEIYKGFIQKRKCILCKPLTYMNLSGEVIRKISNFYKISNLKIIVIHDDLDLIFGKVKIKIGGGNGGHKGLLSIDNMISKDYKRLRIGIGHPGSKDLVSKYVLNNFNKEEKIIITNVINILANNFELIFEKESLLLTKLALEIKKV